MAIEKVERFDWSGNPTHTDVYDGDILIGREVDRSDLGGNYSKTETYDSSWNKVSSYRREDD